MIGDYLDYPLPTSPEYRGGASGLSPRVPFGRGGGWEGVNSYNDNKITLLDLRKPL
jgi:hypothetical protein